MNSSGEWSSSLDLARIESRRVGMSNGGWAYDSCPDLATLDAGATIVVAELSGPALITNIHLTRHFPQLGADRARDELELIAARGVVLQIFFDDAENPAVDVPLADFFADGCSGRAIHFTTPFVEKAPESYNCFIPMPFARGARVQLRNDTKYDLYNYTTVEFEELSSWDSSLGYFHANWQRRAFQLDAESDENFFHVEGKGHLLGQSWSVSTDDPFFTGFHYVMEGNNEFRIDGSSEPTLNYLGTEDSFGFSWGFQKPFAGLHNGITYVRNEIPSQLAIYRFRSGNPIRFEQSLDLRLNWRDEFRTPTWQRWIQPIVGDRQMLPPSRKEGSGWIDYATTFYWYQQDADALTRPMATLEERCAEVLHANPGTNRT